MDFQTQSVDKKQNLMVDVLLLNTSEILPFNVRSDKIQTAGVHVWRQVSEPKTTPVAEEQIFQYSRQGWFQLKQYNLEGNHKTWCWSRITRKTYQSIEKEPPAHSPID